VGARRSLHSQEWVRRPQTEDEALKLPNASLVLLALAALLAPIIGGHISVDVEALEPGLLPLIANLFGGFDAPGLPHLLLGGLVLSAWLLTLSSKEVVLAPAVRFTAPLVGFFAMLALSLAMSSFFMVSLASLAEWMTYGAVFFAVVGSAGRVAGPRLLLFALYAGCVILAIKGLYEYAGVGGNWRVFAGWQHPNVLAGMLLLGLFVGAALTLTLERLEQLAAGAGVVLIILCLSLTQSRGGFLAAGIGALVFIATVFFVCGARKAVSSAIPLLIGLALVTAMSFRGGAAGGPALARIGTPTQEQSSGFRLNLWRSSVSLMAENPAGTGIGTFFFHSARPGLTTPTMLAHQSFLQLGVEAGVFAPILLLGFGAMLLIEMLKGLRREPEPKRMMRIGVLVAILAGAIHCMVDSDLYHMGFGIAFFLLCGVGLLLCSDGVAPELVVTPFRTVLIGSCGLALLVLVYTEWGSIIKARVNGDMRAQNLEGAREGVAQLTSIWRLDGEGYFMRYRLSPPGEARMASLRAAIQYKPSIRNYRMLATEQRRNKDFYPALTSLHRALRWDPNNLPVMLLEMEVWEEAGQRGDAIEAAKRILKVEETPYFKVRALPEQVPTEPSYARLFLAKVESSPERKRELLNGAVLGFQSYVGPAIQNVRNVQAKPADVGRAIEDALRALSELHDLGEDVNELQRWFEEAEVELSKAEADAAKIPIS
jgi:O-antigen ligase